ncbi:hypothetical protein WJX75_008817 [Coccomyxa subellipsoidea]|uniref:Uncharacterized protein n=1 Tax=Coccomyxa subellipsoidea TaxID=248742 RepID=A0ABR2YIK5_9CHLO
MVEKTCSSHSTAYNMWFSRQMGKHSHHPHQGAPLCTPCGYSKDTSGLPFPLPPGCPCRVEELCRADTTGVLNKPPKACGVPRHAAIEQHIDTAVSVLRASSLAGMAASAETDTGCHEAAHLCKKPDKPTWR